MPHAAAIDTGLLLGYNEQQIKYYRKISTLGALKFF